MKYDKLNPLTVIAYFYPEDNEMRRLLLAHSSQVAEKALSIACSEKCQGMPIDKSILHCGAMLHDIGIGRCDAPGIHCYGDNPYITHGVIGSSMLHEWGEVHGVDMSKFASICLHHTGSGITALEVIEQKLPLEEQDYLPETLEEKLICLADKFFSKSHPEQELPYDLARRQMSKFGKASLDRFDSLCALFHV